MKRKEGMFAFKAEQKITCLIRCAGRENVMQVNVEFQFEVRSSGAGEPEYRTVSIAATYHARLQ